MSQFLKSLYIHILSVLFLWRTLTNTASVNYDSLDWWFHFEGSGNLFLSDTLRAENLNSQIQPASDKRKSTVLNGDSIHKGVLRISFTVILAAIADGIGFSNDQIFLLKNVNRLILLYSKRHT